MAETRPFRLLIVEDDPVMVNLFRLLLENTFTIEYAVTLTGAIARATAFPPIDAVLLDLNLDNGSGLAVIRQFREVSPLLPVVVITGMEVTKEEVLEAGGTEFLRKGEFNNNELRECVKWAMARGRANRILAPAYQQVEELKISLAAVPDSKKPKPKSDPKPDPKKSVPKTEPESGG